MRFLTLFLLAAPAAFAESVCALDKRAIRCIKVAEVGVDDLITQAYLAESETATKSVCESLGQITCSCRGDGLAYCEAEDDNWYKFARKCKPVGERSWSHEETTNCDRPWFQTDEAADGAMELEDESEDEAA